mgnify:CR=1 FL=1
MDMAMDMRDCVQFVPDPRPGVNDHIKIRQVIVSLLTMNIYAGTNEELESGHKIQGTKTKIYIPDYNLPSALILGRVSRGMSLRRGQMLLH